jgi:perosamine synthetase
VTNLLFVVGSTAEAVVLVPLLEAARSHEQGVSVLGSTQATERVHRDVKCSTAFDGVSEANPALALARFVERCVPVLQERQPAAVVVHGGSAAAHATAMAANALGISVVLVGVPQDQGRLGALLPLCRIVFAAASAEALDLCERGARTTQIRVVPGLAPATVLAELARGLAATDAKAKAPPVAAPAGTVSLPSDGDATGRTLGFEEVELAAEAIRSGTLNSTKGTFVARFEREFAQRMGRKHGIACASGSAAVHCAIAALAPKAGDEFITTPITDMGALTPIVYEGAVPVFADVDPLTLNVTAATIEKQITARTRAIIVTHLFGLACDMDPIMALAAKRGLPVIEDMAQAFLAEDHRGRVGTRGALACYSLQQGKHMTTGEGGIVTTDDADLARRVFLFVNKAWGYGDPQPDHYFPALNYRLTELQGAVAVAQLQKLEWVVQRRREVAAALGERLQAIPGLQLPAAPAGGQHSWWKYAFFVDPQVVEGGAMALGKQMKARGVFCVPRYIQKPAFECKLFQDWNSSPVTALPLSQNPRRQHPQPLYRRADYPGTVRALERVIVLPINELYTEVHIDYVARVIREEAKVLAHV